MNIVVKLTIIIVLKYHFMIKNIKINKNKIPSLKDSLLLALNFFKEEKQSFPEKDFKKLFIVVGSGNAFNIAKLIFDKQAVIFSSESDFKKILKDYKELINKNLIKEVVVISASGEKDSVWEIKEAKKLKLKTILFTCTKDSTAAGLADEVFVFNKIPEPYTYNISTYLGMLLAKENAKPENILKFIKTLSFPKKFANYKAYSFILPDELEALASMIEIKGHELFGPRLSLRAFSYGQARHAKFVIPYDKELVISLGENKHFGLKENRWQIKGKKKFSPSLALALCYFIVGMIQESKPAYFKNNIENYCNTGPLAYGKKKAFPVIVE